MFSLAGVLGAAANHTTAARLETDEDITTESDYILANVPAFERIF
jgi:hypothetical protein